jgi:hypothetical protein
VNGRGPVQADRFPGSRSWLTVPSYSQFDASMAPCFCGSAPGIVVVGDRVPRFFSCFYPVAGVTLWPFIFVASDVSADEKRTMINHERIHICQANEMLVVFFYLLWVLEFLVGMCRYGSAHAAYVHISLEAEAHANEHDMQYCHERRLWGWTRYTSCAGYPGLSTDDAVETNDVRRHASVAPQGVGVAVPMHSMDDGSSRP